MQMRFCSDQIQKLVDNKLQSSVGLETTQRRLSDIRPSSQQVRDTVVEVQSKIASSRVTHMELQVELEKERYLVCNAYSDSLQIFLVHSSYGAFCLFGTRFAKKKVEEDLEVARRNFSHLKSQDEDSSETDKLQQELGEYRDIVKCSICRDRTKEVIFFIAI